MLAGLCWQSCPHGSVPSGMGLHGLTQTEEALCSVRAAEVRRKQQREKNTVQKLKRGQKLSAFHRIKGRSEERCVFTA